MAESLAGVQRGLAVWNASLADVVHPVLADGNLATPEPRSRANLHLRLVAALFSSRDAARSAFVAFQAESQVEQE